MHKEEEEVERQETELACKIAEEIRLWTTDNLASEALGSHGMAACPFAKGVWFEDRVAQVIIVHELEHVVPVKATEPPNASFINIVAFMGIDSMTPEQFSAWIACQNENHFGVHLIGLHPDIHNTPSGDRRYAVIVMVPLVMMASASRELRDQGYYSGADAHTLRSLDEREGTARVWQRRAPVGGYYAEDHKACGAFWENPAKAVN